MSGTLDLMAIEVLGVTECALDVSAAASREWPCPACGDHQPVDHAWAMKVRNRSGRPMERAVVVCNGCFATLGELLAEEISGEPVTITADDDPIELLGTALDTDEVQIPFGL